MSRSDYTKMRNLFVFGMFTMATLIVVGVITGTWMLVFSGAFSGALILFSAHKLMAPVQWLKRVGAPLSFDAEARIIRDGMAPLLPWQRPKARLRDISFPFAALVATRVRRSDGFRALFKGSAADKAETVTRQKLSFLDDGGFDLDDAAAVGSGYFAAVANSGQQSPLDEEDGLVESVKMLESGAEPASIVAYMMELGPKNAMIALRQGIPLELARPLFASQEEYDD